MKNLRAWQAVKMHKHITLFYSWVYDFFNRCYLMEYLYWKYTEYTQTTMQSQVAGMTMYGFQSGFMSEGRGLSWDKKSRYGLK